ncbi:MAG: PQQ-binding-like beta-propeller repeat protein, partial [Phycisphaerales bacterium]
MTEVWRFESPHRTRPAWPPPASQDFWHQYFDLRATMAYDHAFHLAAVGESVYFGSSADDKIYALDAATGAIRWSFFTEGPVRFAPTFADGKLYVGSDDGAMYCLAAADGKLLWKFETHEQDRRLPGNGRVISLWPVRTGAVVDDQKVYFGAGLFPNEGAYVFALNAQDGSLLWKAPSNVSLQGYMLASTERLYVPTGRTAPAIFARDRGEYLGQLKGAGGTYALLTSDILAAGPGRGKKQISLSRTEKRDTLASFGGLRLIVNEDIAYMQSETQLVAFDRRENFLLQDKRKSLEQLHKELQQKLKELNNQSDKAKELESQLHNVQSKLAETARQLEGCYMWKVDCEYPYAMILAGDYLVVGGNNAVAVRRAADGSEIWRAAVSGKTYGLSAANGRLFVCTDEGAIHCFAKTAARAIPRALRPTITSQPYPTDELSELYASAADQIIAKTNIRKGYCLVLGSLEGRLAYELARRTDLQIVGVEPDAHKVAVARRALDAAGYYGSRVTIHHGSLDKLPYPSYFANLIVSDRTLLTGALPPSAEALFRVLRPCGGIAYLGQPNSPDILRGRLKPADLKRWIGRVSLPDAHISNHNGLWAVIRRPQLPDTGEWTQLYADAGHTACSGDQIRAPLTVQWFGEPGPRQIIDRHHRPMSPLYKDGRLFVPANNRIIALDAYNGTLLWNLSVPDSRRLGALKDCGQMLVTDRHLCIAVQDECRALDPASGKTEFTFKVPQLVPGEKRDWGYLNQFGGYLFGTGQKRGASFNKMDPAGGGNPNSPNKLFEGDFKEVIVSDYLFCLDRQSGEEKWTYKNGTIMNNAITIGHGRIYFAECRNPEIVADPDGRLRIDKFCRRDTFILAVDTDTGRKVWEKPFLFPFEHIMFLSCAKDTLLFTGTFNREGRVHYGLFAFHADTGKEKWQTSYIGLNSAGTELYGTGGEHGEQWQHPVINGDTIYSRPYAFDLHTGEKKKYHAYRGGGGCGGLTGSAYYLYGRGSYPRMYPVETDSTTGIPLTQTNRPGCWLNIIPAG